MEVVVHDGDLDQALRQLKKLVSRSGILKELKLRASFESRGERRKRKGAASRRRLNKQARREDGHNRIR
jgi:ribosomal protein S21